MAQLFSSKDVSYNYLPLAEARIEMTIPPTTIGTIRHGIVERLPIKAAVDKCSKGRKDF